MRAPEVRHQTFDLRLVQASLGNALRARYSLREPMPDRLAQLLREFDSAAGEDESNSAALDRGGPDRQ